MSDKSECRHQSPSRERSPSYSSSPLEAVLTAIGADGKFQILLLVGFLLPLSFYVAIAAFSGHFLLATPNHHCHVPGGGLVHSNSDGERRIILTEERRADGSVRISPCRMYMYNFSVEFVPEQNLSVLLLDHKDPVVTECQYGWEYDLETWPETLTSHFDWVCDMAFVVPTVNTFITVGSALGTLLFSILADSYGRRSVFFAAVVINLVFGMSSLFAKNWKTFAVCRFLEAMALPSIWILAYIIVLESCSKRLRGLAAGLANIAGNFGTLAAAVASYVMAHWKTFGIFCHLPAALIFISLPFLPKSPRWLVSKGRLGESEPIVYKIALINRSRHARDLPALMQRAQLEEQGSSSFLEFFRHPRLLLYLLVSSANSVIYSSILYGIVGGIRGGLTAHKFLNYGILSQAEIPGNILCLVMAKYLGRRMTIIGNYALTAVVCFVAGAVVHIPLALTPVCLVAKIFVTAVHTTVFLQAGEVFPTGLRARAYGVLVTMGKLAGVVVPSVYALDPHNNSVPFFIFGGLGVLGVALSSLLPETLGQALPQTVEDSIQMARNQRFRTWVHHWNKKRYLPIDDQGTADASKHPGDAEEGKGKEKPEEEEEEMMDKGEGGEGRNEKEE